jgi:hypothetical protein
MLRKPPRSTTVREPVQVYLTADDSDLLRRLTESTGLSKAEILRRGIRSFAAAQGGPSPMLEFLAAGADEEWPEGIAADHDAVLAQEYGATRKKRR